MSNMNPQPELPKIGSPSPKPNAGDLIVITSRIGDPAFRRGASYRVDHVEENSDGTLTVHLEGEAPSLKSELGDRWLIVQEG